MEGAAPGAGEKGSGKGRRGAMRVRGDTPETDRSAGRAGGEVPEAEGGAGFARPGGPGNGSRSAGARLLAVVGRTGSLPMGEAFRLARNGNGRGLNGNGHAPDGGGEAAGGNGRLRTTAAGPVGSVAGRSAREELARLTGLRRVHELVEEFVAYLEVQRRRRAMGLWAEQLSMHMVFTGNPGTGKTTVARILGRLLNEAGYLERGHFLEVERADLVGEYVGHTAVKTRDKVRRALGGVLFVDEAYSLARGGERDFGREAIDVLVKAMEDHRDRLAVIFAGYPAEMEHLLRQNPGLRSRVALHVEFPDYTDAELLAIAVQMAADRDYALTPSALAAVTASLTRPDVRRSLRQGNARFVRNLLERAIRRQALRLAGGAAPREAGREKLMALTAQDVAGALDDCLLGGRCAASPLLPFQL